MPRQHKQLCKQQQHCWLSKLAERFPVATIHETSLSDAFIRLNQGY
jgi:hypothetical protein